ncbi:MAG: ABC transporter permease, partial [Bacteroidota bacterium]
PMFRNYLKIVFRSLVRDRIYTLINILGLAIGLAACLLTYLFVDYELNFDGFHPESEQVYRLNEVQSWEGIIPQKVALSMYPMGPTMVEEFPEVEAYTRLFTWDEIPLMVGDKQAFAEKFYWADSAFFDLFGFEVLAGDPETALDRPNAMILTQSVADRIFGDWDVVGDYVTVLGEDTFEFAITAVLADIPDNSHLQFDGLLSLNTLRTPEMGEENRMSRWGNNWLVTYLKLTPGADIAALEAKFPAYLQKHMGEEATDGYQLFVQSLSEVHLGSADITHDYQNYHKFDGRYVNMFALLALFVLIIASINFMNLSTARSARRAREVGVRKTIGATRGHLSRQFLLESIVFSAISMVLALGITALAIPSLQGLSQRELSFMTLLQPLALAGIVGITLLVGLLAGWYPAILMAAFKPITALKGKIFSNTRRFSLQNVLVVTQFMIATGLIVGTVLTVQQLRYMTQADPGFDRDQVVLLPTNQDVSQNLTSFIGDLRRIGGVSHVAGSGQRLGNNIHQTGIRTRTDTAEQGLAISHLNVGHDYLKLYNIKLLAGRDFDQSFSQDSGRSFLINESLAAKFGWEPEEAVGRDMKFGWQEEWGKVIGVTPDFQYNSLHHAVNPLAISVQPWGYEEVSVKIAAKDLSAVLPQLEEAWMGTGTDRPFRYSFLDAHFEEVYRADRQVAQVVSIVAGLAILIACLGLFGLVSVAVERRTKEIGIRRALGATPWSIVSQIVWEAIVLTAVAGYTGMILGVL